MIQRREDSRFPLEARQAIRVGDELWIGTFAGDRLLRAKLPDWVTKPNAPG